MKLLVTVWRFAATMVAAVVVVVVSLGLIGGIAETSAARTPAPTADATTRPTFAEECSTALRPEWRALDNAGDPGYGLDSDFHGDLRQVTVADGICTITAERAMTSSGRPYASAAMSTNGAFAQLYGTFEIRVRYPNGQAMWPAFWLLMPQMAVEPPPEIDVFEAYPGKPGLAGRGGSSVVFSTLHYAGGSHSFVYDHGSDMTRDFHTHRLTWTPGVLVFSVDGVETGRISNDVPDVPMYPIISLAVGAPGYRADQRTPAVATMDVDYLRVWAY